jgi:20S proteasome alpha/beta subunit
MTIAAGFVCSNGVVLAADSEHSTDVVKFERRKVFQCKKKNYGFAVAGAGRSDLIRLVVDELRDKLSEKDKLPQIRRKIKKLLKEVCDEHIFSTYQATDPYRPRLLLLVAARMDTGENALWKTDDKIIATVDGCEFVGAGDSLAMTVASWLYDPSLSTGVVNVLAMQIIRWVKEHVPGCGKATHAVSVVGIQGSKRVIRTFCSDEEFFWGLNELLRPILIGCIDEKMTDSDFDSRIVKFSEKMRAVRQAFQQQRGTDSMIKQLILDAIKKPEPGV